MLAPIPSGQAHGEYRPDIDGLRALAVLAVLGFHAFPSSFPGGFVGVDIFFVISGYLITRLIAADLDAGSFTISGFYGRRIRRIFPALGVVLVFVVLAGWLLMLPDEWIRLGRETFASAAFVANLSLIRQGSYFDWSANFKPLLHLWSLGVEEQFYFVWPVFIALLWRVSFRVRLAVLLASVVVSFALCLFATFRYPMWAFYLPVTRLWELGAGSLAAVASHRRDGGLTGIRAEVASISGMLLCVAGIAGIREEHPFPGFFALLPVAGTTLLILGGRGSSLNGRVLSRPIWVFIGLISYPLYLWHWPLLAFARIANGGMLSTTLVSLLLAASGILAWLTFRLVERPVRRAPWRSVRVFAWGGVLGAVAVAGVMANRGVVEPRLDSSTAEPVLRAAADWNYPFGENYRRSEGFTISSVAGSDPGAVLFIGDSHMEQLWPRIERFAGRGPELRFATNGGCPPISGLAIRRKEVCDRFVDFPFEQAASPDVHTIVLAASWQTYLGDVRDEQTVAALANFSRRVAAVRGGRRVFLILPTPAHRGFDPRASFSRWSGRLRPRDLPAAGFDAETKPVTAALTAIAAETGAIVIDPVPSLCPAGSCPATTPDGDPLYKDWSHMRASSARERAVFVDRVFERPAGASAAAPAGGESLR